MNLNIWKTITFFLLLIILVIVSPFLISITSFNFSESISQNLFIDTLAKTFSFALFSSLALVCFGFFGALMMKDVPFFSSLGKSMGLLILPVILGNLSTAFIFKILLSDTSLFAQIVQSEFSVKVFYFILLQIWQFGFLFVYLFWLNVQNIPKNVMEYSFANKFSLFQNIKDIYYPNSKNLIVLLAFVGFTFSLFEESKIQYLFKVSRGTDSELITNWLVRNYQSLLLINAETSEKFIYNNSFVILLSSILVSVLIFISINKFSEFFVTSKFYILNSLRDFNTNLKTTGKIWAIVLLMVMCFPIVIFLSKIDFSLDPVSKLGFPILMTFIATSVSVVFAVIFGISSRLGWRSVLSSFNNNSVTFFITLFLLMLIPPIVILISGFKWMSVIGYRTEGLIYIVWIIGHTILTLPLLGSFVLFNHFRVKNNELDYQNVYKLKKSEIIRFSFISRFKVEYILLFIIGFSFIWNDAVLNNLFSDYIPSFAAGLKMLITGRGADFEKAFGFLIVSFLIAVSSVALWRYLIGKASKLQG